MMNIIGNVRRKSSLQELSKALFVRFKKVFILILAAFMRTLWDLTVPFKLHLHQFYYTNL